MSDSEVNSDVPWWKFVPLWAVSGLLSAGNVTIYRRVRNIMHLQITQVIAELLLAQAS